MTAIAAAGSGAGVLGPAADAASPTSQHAVATTTVTGTLDIPDGVRYADIELFVRDAETGDWGHSRSYTSLSADGRWTLKIPVTAGEVLVRIDNISDADIGEQGFLALAPNRIVATPSRASVIDVSGGGTVDVGNLVVAQGQALQGTVPGAIPGSYVVDAETGEQAYRLRYTHVSDRWEILTYDGTLPAGTYTIHWAMDTGYTVYTDQYYDQVPAEQGLAAADDFTAADSGPAIVVVPSLVVGGVAKGRLVDPDGAAVLGCSLTAVETRGVLAGRRSTTLKGDGSFTLPGLSSADYLLEYNADGSCLGPRLWLAGDHLVKDRADAVPVEAGVGATIDLGTITHPASYRVTPVRSTVGIWDIDGDGRIDRPLPRRYDAFEPDVGIARFQGEHVFYTGGWYRKLRDGRPVGSIHALTAHYVPVAEKADIGHRVSFRFHVWPAGGRTVVVTTPSVRVRG